MKMKSFALAIAIPVVMAGTVLVSVLTGYWQTTGSKTPGIFAEGAYAGQYDPGDIKGSYTFGDISTAFGIPVSELAKAFGVSLETDASSMRVNALEALYAGLADQGIEIGTDSVRYFVALYKGLPIILEKTPTWLPKPAVELLLSKAALTDAQKADLNRYSVDLPQTASGTMSDDLDKSIKGSTTFQNLLDWGVKRTDIEAAIGGGMPTASTLIKDYAGTIGVDFSVLKAALQPLADAARP